MGARDLILEADDLVASIFREHLSPPPRLTVTQWAEKHRVLSSKDSSEPGPYRSDRTPYVREPQDALSVHSVCEAIILVWGSQTGKTSIGLNWLGYSIHVNPGPMMVMWPTINVAKRNSRQRITPMIDSTEALRARVSERKSRDESNTMTLKDFTGGQLAIVGANSGSDLSSMPVRDIFMDEVDRFPDEIPGEGRPMQLAEARQTTFPRRKRLITSTPTTKDFSEIERLYLGSDRCRYHLPCPHCGEMQPLEWGATSAHGLKWRKHPDDEPDLDSVHYVCRACGGEIGERHKPKMLAAGQWVPEVQSKRVRGFHLSSLYSPLGWLSWRELVAEWHTAQIAKARGDTSLLRVFVNTRLAETFEEDGDKVGEHALKKRAPDIPLGVVHTPLSACTMGVDVQGDRLEARVWAWGRGMERQLVDRHILYGDPSASESEAGSPWAELTKLRRAPIPHASGGHAPLLAVMIDTGGHHTQAVYHYCRTHRGANVRAVKGSSRGGQTIVGKATDQDVNWRGEKLKRGVKLWSIGTDTAKSEIYGRLRNDTPGPGYVWLSKHLPADEFEQLTCERLVTRYVKGRPKLEWVKPPGRRNEGLDCAVYALAAAHSLEMERWSDAKWAALAMQVAAPTPAPAAQSTAPPTTQPAAAPAPRTAGSLADQLRAKFARRG